MTILVRHLAVETIKVRFETSARLLYESQLQALQALAARGSLPVSEVQGFYDEAKRKWPAFYASLPL